MVGVETEGGGTLAKHHHPPAQRADVSRKLEKREPAWRKLISYIQFRKPFNDLDDLEMCCFFLF